MAEPSVPPTPATPPLVGREREQAVLREALAATLAGRGSLVLIGGEAGIGKTALAEALCQEAAEQGALVLVGRCYDLSETPPYGPWRELFAVAPRDSDVPSLPAAILPEGGGGEPLTSQEALFARLRDYLAALAARRPLVLLLDDLHWADPASLDLLRVLARGLAALPVLCLATYRADELTRRHPLYQRLPTLAREARATRLDLRPLGEAALRALVGRYALAGDAAARLVAWLQVRAQGNAFFTAQLLRALEDEGALGQTAVGRALGDLGAVGLPAPLRQVLDARLDRLGEAARQLLALAAVIGQEVPLPLWAAVAETDEDALLETIERGVEARLLTALPAGDAVRFAHALVREALYEGTLPPRRRRLHRRAAEALIATAAPDPDPVAYHLRQAGDPRAAAWLVQAGQRAEQTFAFATAAERFEAALALLAAAGADPVACGWLRLDLAMAHNFADPGRSLAYLDEAARAAGDDRALAALTLFMQGWLLGVVGQVAAGLPPLAAGVDALEALGPGDRARLAAHAHLMVLDRVESCRGLLVASLAQVGRFAEALAMGERFLAAVPAPSAGGAPGRRPPAFGYGDAHLGLGLAYAWLGRPDAARAAFARARPFYEPFGHQLMVGLIASSDLVQVLLPYQADRVAERRRVAAEVEQAWQRVEGVGYTPPRRIAAAAFLLLEGRWAAGRALALAALAARPADNSREAAAQVLGRLARAQGDPALAWAQVRETLPDGPATAPGTVSFHEAVDLLRLAAGLALDAGDREAARAWLGAHDRWLAWSGAVPGRAEGQLGWAAYHRAADDLALAREHAARALAQATEPRQPLALLAAHRALGELATDAGRHADAERHLSEALALAEACAAPYERALTLLALAELRLASGDRGSARAALAEARAILEPLDALPALRRAAALAGARAAPPDTPPPGSPARLSAREAEVLCLLAAGRSNREMAGALGISARTVERHITNLYTKIGARNRADATAYALRHRLA